MNYTNQVEKLIYQVLALAIKVQSRTQFGIWINLSGHVDILEITIRDLKDHESKKWISERVILNDDESVFNLQHILRLVDCFIDDSKK